MDILPTKFYFLPRIEGMSICKSLSILLFSSVCMVEAIAQVTINSMTVVEDHYSKKIVAVEFDYDGSLGAYLSVGAIPAANRDTVRSGYSVNSIQEGVSTANIAVQRPATEDNRTVDSWAIEFRFATLEGRRLLTLTERINLDWPSIKDYYDITDAPEEILSSVSSIRVNEALGNTTGLIQWLGERSNFIDAIEIYHFDSSPPPPGLMPLNTLNVSEDVSFADLSLLLLKLQELQTEITSVQFIHIDDEGYKRGMIAIGHDGYIAGPAEPPRPIDELVALSSLEEAYESRNFEPTPPEEFSTIMLDRIIALNDQSSRSSSRQAQEIIDLLLERDPDQPRAYVELARSQFQTAECCEQELAARNIMNIALALFPDDAYVNHYAGYVEYESDEFEKALLHFRLADQQRDEDIIWLTNNWANTLLSLGRVEEAFEKFSTLLNLNNLNASDSRALYFGLVDYADALTAHRSRDAGPVYLKLITEFPERARCVPVDYAQYILFTESNINRARQVLGQGEQYQCDSYSVVDALVDIYTWYGDGITANRPALYRSFLKHPQVDELIYRIATSFNPVPLLQALSENGIDLDQLNAYGAPAIQQAISDSNIFAITSLAAAGANINEDMGEGFTPLLYALFMEDVDAIRALVDAGADPNEMTEFGVSAMKLAEQVGNQEFINALRSSASNDV